MSKYINCLIIENTELTNNLKYWESFPAGDNTGKLMRSRMIKKITERLNTVAKSTNVRHNAVISRNVEPARDVVYVASVPDAQDLVV